MIPKWAIWIGMTTTMAVLVVGAAFVSASSARADEGEQGAALAVTLEDSVFAEGQSIYMLMRLRNTGRTDLTDVSMLTPRAGFLRLNLTRLDTGVRLRETMPILGGSPDWEGTVVRPGHLLCTVRDLLSYFGTESSEGSSISDRLAMPSLPAGTYRLDWQYTLHTGHNASLPRVVLKGGSVRFSIVPLAHFPDELKLVNDSLRGLPVVRPGEDRVSLHAHCREWLPRFYGSRFLIRVYLDTGVLLDSLDFDAIVDGAIKAGAPPGRVAALLGVRLSMTDVRGQFTPEWKQRMAQKATSALEREILTMTPPRK